MQYLVFIFCFALITSCASQPYDKKQNSKESTMIYVTNHSWHTGIVIPSKLIQDRLPLLQQRFANKNFIEIGWGDRGFYQAKEITAELTIKAILWPTESVVHAVAFNHNPKEYFTQSEVKSLCLSQANYIALTDFIINSFAKSSQGHIIEMSPGIYGDSRFYRGKGNYSLVRTCNKWTAEALQTAGVEISPNFILTAESVMEAIEDSSHCPSKINQP